MQIAKRCLSAIDNISKWSGVILAPLVLAYLFTTVFEITSRYVFNASFAWGEEVVGAFAVWCVFLGASACYKRGMHIGIDVVVGLLPPFPKRIVRILVNLISMITTAYLSYLSLVFALAAWVKRTQVLEIRYTYIDIAAFLGFGLMTLYAARQLADDVRGDDAAMDQNRKAAGTGQVKDRQLLEA